LLIGGLVLFVFSIFFYTSIFYLPGNGIALHSGRLSIILSVSGDPGRMPVSFNCDRTSPTVLFSTLHSRGTQSFFFAFPLWTIGIPAAILLLADAWLVLRAHHGNCFGCGYNLHGLPAGTCCPECGRSARDSRTPTRPELIRSMLSGLRTRALWTLTLSGLLVALLWAASPLYFIRYSHDGSHSIAIVHGQMWVQWYRPHATLSPAEVAEETRLAYEPETPLSRKFGYRPPQSRHFAPGLTCVPTSQIRCNLGGTLLPIREGRLRTLILPLWALVLPLLACAIPVLRWPRSRRRARVSTTPVPSDGAQT
jgi:hypothetical protein